MSVLHKALAVGILVCAAVISAASAQQSRDRVYVLHSGAAGGCPSLDWHIVVEANGVLSGMIAWNHMKTMARATGTLDRKKRTFTIIATEIGDQAAQAEIQGSVKDNGWLAVSISGPKITCKAVVVPIYIPPPGIG
jgi:hypothetical protein